MRRRSMGGPLPDCVYNQRVECQWGDRMPKEKQRCERCGWSPEVQQRRAEDIRRKVEADGGTG